VHISLELKNKHWLVDEHLQMQSSWDSLVQVKNKVKPEQAVRF